MAVVPLSIIGSYFGLKTNKNGWKYEELLSIVVTIVTSSETTDPQDWPDGWNALVPPSNYLLILIII